MVEGQESTGVCILRVWRRPDGLVVQLRARDDVEEPATEWSRAVVEVDDAVALVRAFLLRLAGTGTAAEAAPSPRPPPS